MQKNNGDWYGMWVWDYLNHKRNSLADEAWGAYGIWREAYLEAHPEFSEESELELIEIHYPLWTESLFSSWVFRAWIWFHKPSVIVRQIAWRVRRKFS